MLDIVLAIPRYARKYVTFLMGQPWLQWYAIPPNQLSYGSFKSISSLSISLQTL